MGTIVSKYSRRRIGAVFLGLLLVVGLLAFVAGRQTASPVEVTVESSEATSAFVESMAGIHREAEHARSMAAQTSTDSVFPPDDVIQAASTGDSDAQRQLTQSSTASAQVNTFHRTCDSLGTLYNAAMAAATEAQIWAVVDAGLPVRYDVDLGANRCWDDNSQDPFVQSNSAHYSEVLNPDGSDD